MCRLNISSDITPGLQFNQLCPEGRLHNLCGEQLQSSGLLDHLYVEEKEESSPISSLCMRWVTQRSSLAEILIIRNHLSFPTLTNHSGEIKMLIRIQHIMMNTGLKLKVLFFKLHYIANKSRTSTILKTVSTARKARHISNCTNRHASHRIGNGNISILFNFYK